MAISTRSVSTVQSVQELLFSKPTGLAVGDLMVAICQSFVVSAFSVPSGFSLVQQITTGSATYTTIYAKIADSGDVAASNFSFFQSPSTPTRMLIGALYAIIEGDNSNIQVITSGGVTPVSFTSLVILNGNAYDNDSDAVTFSAYSVTGGASPTFTERFDTSDNAGSEYISFAVADGVYSSATAISAYNITNSGGADDVTNALILVSQIPETVSVSEALSLVESQTVARGIVSTIAETLSLTESVSIVKTLVTNILENLSLGEYFNVTKWINEIKGTDSWESESKPTTTFTKENKGSSVWTELDK